MDTAHYRLFQKPIEAQIEAIVEAMTSGKTECATTIDCDVYRSDVLPHVVSCMNETGWRLDYHRVDENNEGMSRGLLSWLRLPVTVDKNTQRLHDLLASVVCALREISREIRQSR